MCGALPATAPPAWSIRVLEGFWKKPYLKRLGVNAVELMPVFEFDETMGGREVNGQKLLDYWGYNTVGFFAPNTSYTAGLEYNREGDGV